MFEIIVVAGIVAIAAFISGRSFLRNMTAKNNRCNCTGNCSGCVCCDFLKNEDGDKKANDGL